GAGGGAELWGEKNQGFDVLYHNMKHGQISAKELADFVRERAAVEEAYAKSMVKMSKMAGNSTQLGTFAPLWEVFRISSDKLALCHAELVKKLQDLLKEIGRYGEEQLRAHRKSKDEVAGTLEAVQQLQGAAQHLPKAKEAFHSRCQELERLRREGAGQKELDKAELKSRKAMEALRRTVEKYNAARADFEQKMLDSAVRFQEVEESHLQHLKALVGSYIHSVEDTHVQIGQVQEEFKQNMENIGVETLLRNFAEGKGTGCTPPGEGPPRGGSPDGPAGISTKDPIQEARGPLSSERCRWKEGLAAAASARPVTQITTTRSPPKFYIRIKPVQPPERVGSAATSAATEQLKASVGSLILPPGVGGPSGSGLGTWGAPSAPTSLLFQLLGGPAAPNSVLTLPSSLSLSLPAAPRAYLLASSPSPFSSSSPENVEDSGLDSPPHLATGPSPDPRLWSSRPATPLSPPGQRTPKGPLAFRGGRGALLHEERPNPWLPQPSAPQDARSGPEPDFAVSGASWPPAGARAFSTGSPDLFSSEAGRGRSPPPEPAEPPCPALQTLWAPSGCVSRGPSPVVLGSQGALPVATAFTEYIHAYFKGQEADSCLVKVTGELTMSFPAGIVRVFSTPIEQFLPNASLLFSDASQSDPSRRDFWLNMAALTGHLQKQAEQSGTAPYYNVTLLRYQYSRQGPQWAPLQLSVSWECGPEATRVSVDYRYNASALASPVALANVQVLLPIEEPVANVRPQPKACWNLEEKRLLWRLLDVPSTQGSGRLLASWEPLDGPSRPSPVAAQFTSEGSTVSGADVELVGSGYRMSLVKKRFATGGPRGSGCSETPEKGDGGWGGLDWLHCPPFEPFLCRDCRPARVSAGSLAGCPSPPPAPPPPPAPGRVREAEAARLALCPPQGGGVSSLEPEAGAEAGSPGGLRYPQQPLALSLTHTCTP
uniref:FCH and mu domain containing endocytic adaptor 1 n=1 Tax=Pseudonaja textilis TaxID=8673 RepID=A0A670ZFE1_PSETE